MKAPLALALKVALLGSAFSLTLLAFAQEADSAEPILTVEQAITLARQDNRLVRNAELEAAKYDDRVAETRTHLLPVFDINVLEVRTLQNVNLNFPAGMFGTFPGIGPFPPTASRLTAPAQWGTFAEGGVSQPLTQLYRVNLGIQAQKLERDEAHEKLRAHRQATAAEVKRAYYEILQTQSAWDATQEEIKLYRELDRLTSEYWAQQAVLKSDSLEGKAQLAKAEYQSTVLSDGLSTQKEALNNLLGRDVRTKFRVSEASEPEAYANDMEAAERRALEQRPELKEASLKQQQAEYDRRIKKSEYIPDLSLTARYVSPLNVLFSPNSVGAVGFYFSWEPFDWGRKSHELAEKSKTIEQAKNGLKETESQIILDVDNRFRKLKEAEALLKVDQLALEAAQEKLRVSTNQYREQSGLLREVLEQQAVLAEKTHQYQQSLLSFWIARADLEKSLGEE